MFFPVVPSRSVFHGREPDPSPLTERKRVYIVRSSATLSGVVHVEDQDDWNRSREEQTHVYQYRR